MSWSSSVVDEWWKCKQKFHRRLHLFDCVCVVLISSATKDIVRFTLWKHSTTMGQSCLVLVFGRWRSHSLMSTTSVSFPHVTLSLWVIKNEHNALIQWAQIHIVHIGLFYFSFHLWHSRCHNQSFVLTKSDFRTHIYCLSTNFGFISSQCRKMSGRRKETET